MISMMATGGCTWVVVVVALLVATTFAQPARTLGPEHFHQLRHQVPRPASSIPWAGCGPILKIDQAHFDDGIGGTGIELFEDMMLHENSVRNNQTGTAPYILCGPQSSAARDALAPYSGGDIVVEYSSRVQGIVCYRAHLDNRDAQILSESSYFFHCSPVPALAKFAPGLLSLTADGRSVQLKSTVRSAIVIHLKKGLDIASRLQLARDWSLKNYGLNGGDHEAFFFPRNRLRKWINTFSAVSGLKSCSDVLHIDVSEISSAGPIEVSLSGLPSSNKFHCAAVALSFFAVDQNVDAIEPRASFQHLSEPISTRGLRGSNIVATEQSPSTISHVFERRTGRDLVDVTRENLPYSLLVASAIQTGGSGDDPMPFWTDGVIGEGTLVQVVDTGLDDASCLLSDTGDIDTRLSGPFNPKVQVQRSTPAGPITDLDKRKVVQYIGLDTRLEEYRTDYAVGHGSSVAGVVGGSAADTAIVHNIDAEAACADYVDRCSDLFCANINKCPGAGRCDETCDIAPDTVAQNFNGMAPGAQLMMFDVGDTLGSLQVPMALGETVFQPAHDAGAHIHSNSWGNLPPYEFYDEWVISLDRYVYETDDALVLVAAGNTGSLSGDQLTAEDEIGSPACSKNALTVGAAETDAIPTTVAKFSKQGPTLDSRIKPEVSAGGDPVWTVFASGEPGLSTCHVIPRQGTSFTCPAVAGAAALVQDVLKNGGHVKYSALGYYGSQYNEDNPSAALQKAILIGSTKPLSIAYNPEGNPVAITENEIVDPGHGFGHVALSNAFAINSGDTFETFLFEGVLKESSTWTAYFSTAINPMTDVKIVLVWSDPPGPRWCDKYFSTGAADANCLVHDLDLKVTHRDKKLFPNGLETEDILNNVEKVVIKAANLAAGDLIKVQVQSHGLSYASSQKFAVVVIGNFDSTTTAGSSPTS